MVVGVPLIVKTLPTQEEVTPGGNPVAVPLPVAPVVARVIEVIATFLHIVCVEVEATVLVLTVIVPLADKFPHVLVSGIE